MIVMDTFETTSFSHQQLFSTKKRYVTIPLVIEPYFIFINL
nr:MAG TPA: hypothetical protein [Caudoviricetes sp.]